VPVYLAAVLVWKYALGRSWLYSVGGYPLGILAAGVIYCGVTSALTPAVQQLATENALIVAIFDRHSMCDGDCGS
jgi:hypothetical protein